MTHTIRTALVGLLLALLATTSGRAQRGTQDDVQLKAAITMEAVDGKPQDAIPMFRKLAASSNRQIAAEAWLHLAQCYEKLGATQVDEARRAYEQLVRGFGDQPDVVAQARARLAALNGGASPDALRVRKLFDGYGTSVSRDGREVLGQDNDLRIVDVQTGTSRRLRAAPTGRSESVDRATLSPDGRHVAYALLDFEKGTSMHVLDVESGQDRVVASIDGPETCLCPLDWSPDGREVLASRWTGDNDETGALVAITITTGAERAIASVGYWTAQFAPDGRHILVQDKNDILSLPAAGGPTVPVVDHPATDQFVGWAPDGRLVFVSDRSGARDVWALRVQDGRAVGAPEVILKDIGQKVPIGVASDGTLFVRQVSPNAEIYLAELDAAGRLASGPTPITAPFAGANIAPDYSPDGRYLAYVSGLPRSLRSEIRVRTLASGEERALVSPARNVAQLRWYADGKSLLVLGGNGQGRRMYKLDVQTGASSVVVEKAGGYAAVNPTFSPDGRFLYYETAPTPDVHTLSRMDVSTGAIQEVLRVPSGYLRLWSLSPDGATIVYNWRRDAQDFLYTVPVSGGQAPTLIHEVPKTEWRRAWGGLAWGADGRSIFYHDERVQQGDELIRISAAGGPSEALFATGIIHRIAVHPDGRHLAIESRANANETFAMEHVFAAAANSTAAAR